MFNEGFLPVFSVFSEEDAKDLITLACETNGRGEYIARELVREQTLENLELFGNRLQRTYEFLLARKRLERA